MDTFFDLGTAELELRLNGCADKEEPEQYKDKRKMSV